MQTYKGTSPSLERLESDVHFGSISSERTLLGHGAAWRRSLQAIAITRRCAIGLTILILLAAGLELRRWTWTQTAQIRFRHDIDNALYWGGRVLDEGQRLTEEKTTGNTVSWKALFTGYLVLYDVAKSEAYDSDYHLDYPPLRLLVMAVWAKHTRQFHRAADKTSLEVVWPMLACNFLAEVASLTTIFLLVRLWVRRDHNRAPPFLLRTLPEQHRGWVAGLLAAACLWLNPSVILEAYGWPQWDVWVLPFFLLAALAASTDRWIWCGCILALGGMFKGQLLLVVPFFILWPIWLSRWKAACRVVSSLAITSAVLVLPWLTRNDFNWLQVGFVYGTEHYPQLFISSCYNLPALLSKFGWSLKDTLARSELGGVSIELTVQWALRLLYLASLAAASRAAASYAQKKDARILLAIAAPWLLMFGLLGQMHERYLLWGGAVTAVAVAISLRATLLHLLFTTLSTVMIGHVMLLDKKLPATVPLIAFLNNEMAVASMVFLAALSAFLWLMIRPTTAHVARSTRVPAWRSQQTEPEFQSEEAISKARVPIAVV